MPDSSSRKCFAGILSRLLCSGSLPTHPSEQLIESGIEKLGDWKTEKCFSTEHSIKQVVGTAGAASPGVVARLMGLESFPADVRERKLGDYFRSKSVNSIDFLSHFDPIQHGHHLHRRVRTSVSFRMNDDLTSIILQENGDEEELVHKEQEQGKKEMMGRKNREESFQVSDIPGKNLEMEKERKSGPGNSASQKKDFHGKRRVNFKERMPIIKADNSKEEMVGSKFVKKKEKKILGHCNKKIHPQAIVQGREMNSRKQPPCQAANTQSPNSRSIEIREKAVVTRKKERKVKIKESCYYKRMVEEIFKQTEEDLKENWIDGVVLKYEDFEEISQQFGQEILQVLLNQFVDELVLLFGTQN